MKKTEDELEKIERKYHTATKDVELLRQACDAEMYRVNIYRNYFFLTSLSFIWLELRSIAKNGIKSNY
jgi:hypothetical protein